MKRWSALVCVLIWSSGVFSALAQKNAKAHPTVFLFPDFLHVDVSDDDDTTWIYEYYDKYLHKISMFDLKDVSEIDQIKFFKTYKASADAFSASLYELVYRFVQLDTNIWVRVDKLARQRQRYEMIKGNVVRIDTVKLVDPVTRKERKVVYKYLKTRALGEE